MSDDREREFYFWLIVAIVALIICGASVYKVWNELELSIDEIGVKLDVLQEDLNEIKRRVE